MCVEEEQGDATNTSSGRLESAQSWGAHQICWEGGPKNIVFRAPQRNGFLGLRKSRYGGLVVYGIAVSGMMKTYLLQVCRALGPSKRTKHVIAIYLNAEGVGMKKRDESHKHVVCIMTLFYLPNQTKKCRRIC